MTSAEVRGRLSEALDAASADLLRYFLRRLEPEDAADALAELGVVAWKRAKSMPEEPEEARMWLFGIARNTLLHAQRGSLRRRKLADELKLTLVTRPTSPAADAGLEVRDAVSRLPEPLAEIVRLVHWEKFSLVEAAELMGIPASTARGRYQRAREELRDQLSEEGAKDARNAIQGISSP